MKENLSFLKLVIRSSFSKFLALVGLVCLIQAVLFVALTTAGRGYESALDAAPITAAAGVGLMAAVILLLLPWAKSGQGRPLTTLNRLRITTFRAAFWLIVYNSLCFLIFWAAQLALFLLLCKGFLVSTGASGHLHLICLAAWRVDYFHMLLPLGDVPELARNIVLVFGFGVMTAALVMEDTLSIGAYLCVVLTTSKVITAATDGAGEMAVFYFIDIGIVAVLMICQIWMIKKACRNKEEPVKRARGDRKRPGNGRGRKELAS